MDELTGFRRNENTKLGTLDTFYAYSDNLESIQQQREIIIFEGVKSACRHMGDTQPAALTSLSEHQVNAD